MFPTRVLHTAALGAPLLLGAAVGFATPPAPGPEAPPPRPIVLMLPGRGLPVQDSATLRQEWRLALNRGLTTVGGRWLTEDDLRVVWYAEALDPRAPVECDAERSGATASSAPVRELGSVFAATGALLALAAEWTGEVGGDALRAIAGDLLYFGDQGKRCAAEQRVSRALREADLEGRPVVLVAHSFGSLVAHNHFRNRGAEATEIERYVTIGSLVGLPELREVLLGDDPRGMGLPAGVRSWVNVRDPRDPLAHRLVGLSAAGSVGVHDLVTEDRPAGDPHDAARYLADPVTARAVLEGWCAALGEDGQAEWTCPTAAASR